MPCSSPSSPAPRLAGQEFLPSAGGVCAHDERNARSPCRSKKERKKEMRTNNKRETMIQQVVKKRIGPPGPTCPGGLLLYPQTSLAKTQ